MYLRHSTVRKDGKTHTYWRLVRSVRRNGKVVQELPRSIWMITVLTAPGPAKSGMPSGTTAMPSFVADAAASSGV